MPPESAVALAPRRSAEALSARYGAAPAEAALQAALRLYAGRIAIVSSFGAESAVLLHMTSRIDPHAPVLMIDTLMLFPETIAYQQELSSRLGLTAVRRISPEPGALRRRDPDGSLHLADPDACCALRKAEPLERALEGFAAHVSGRKRFQTPARREMPVFETDAAGRIKVNPLAAWRPDDLVAYMRRHALPPHPLAEKGFRSIGCAPCTSRVQAGEDARAGRWRGFDKTECGIHFGPDGLVRRSAS